MSNKDMSQKEILVLLRKYKAHESEFYIRMVSHVNPLVWKYQLVSLVHGLKLGTLELRGIYLPTKQEVYKYSNGTGSDYQKHQIFDDVNEVIKCAGFEIWTTDIRMDMDQIVELIEA